MTFLAYLHAHPDPAVQCAAQYLYGGEQGPTDLGEACGTARRSRSAVRGVPGGRRGVAGISTGRDKKDN